MSGPKPSPQSASERPALKKAIDRLYAGGREDFVSERNALAKRLKADGRDDDSARVRKLKKPTVSAAAVNRLAHGHRKEIKAFAKAAAALRKAMSQAKGDRLRAAAKGEREAAAALIALAEGESEAGDGANAAAISERVAETLQAAAADPEVEALLLAGRLERERSAVSIGFDLSATVEEVSANEPSAAERKRDERARAKARREADRALRELEAAERVRDKAQKGVADAEGKVAEAEERLVRARRDAGDAEAAVEEVGRKLRDRERDLEEWVERVDAHPRA